MQDRPPLISLICSSSSSGRDFAAGFLQIPPHEGHPCLWLTLPTAKCVRVFHPIVIAHAGRTRKSLSAKAEGLYYYERCKLACISKIIIKTIMSAANEGLFRC